MLSTWCAELARWAPSLKAVKLHSSDPDERERLRGLVLDGIGEYDVVVTTYEMVKSASMRQCLVQKVHWRLLVLDEGHVLKNTETEISQTVRKMHAASILLLTGTPLQARRDRGVHSISARLTYEGGHFPAEQPDRALGATQPTVAHRLHHARRLHRRL